MSIFGHTEGESNILDDVKASIDKTRTTLETLGEGKKLPRAKLEELIDNNYGWLALEHPESFEGVDLEEMKRLIESRQEKAE